MVTRLKSFGIIAVVLSGLLLAGCNGDADALTKSEKANLKGGPMPAGAKEGMAKSMAEAGAHPFVHKASDYAGGGSAPADKK